MSAAAKPVDLAAIGYPAVRQAFNDLLRRCVARLGKADFATAQDVLGVTDPDAFEQSDAQALDIHILMKDTALYSRPGNAVTRLTRKRPIDRIVRKLPPTDELSAHLAARLPFAFFSIFEVAEPGRDGRIVLTDLLDGGRRIQVFDNSLASTGRAGTVVAGRFVDLGPWHIGFGTVVALRRSEAAAIVIALSQCGELEGKRDDLHELIYACRLHDEDLVMEAAMPVIAAFAAAVDSGALPLADVVTGFETVTAAARPVAAE
jgi:hypothetical protein